MASTNTGEFVKDLNYWIRFRSDGTVERLQDSPFVPPSLNDPTTGVSSKDVTISDNPPISARIYLPNLTANSAEKLPICVYFHGGGFFFESTFGEIFHSHLTKLVHQANVILVSVEYRLAPENPLPAAYDDCWAALKWVASNSAKNTETEPWIAEHGDFNRVFVGGDSAGGNIVYNIISPHLRPGSEDLPGKVQIFGAILIHPYFYGSEPIGSVLNENFYNLVWKLVYPSAPNGIDNPLINPFAPGAPGFDDLACSAIIVCVAGKDDMRDRQVLYYEAVKKSGWKGKIEYFEEKEEDHAYHLLKPETEAATKFINRIASFFSQ